MKNFAKVITTKKNTLVVHISVQFKRYPKVDLDLILYEIEQAYLVSNKELKLEDIDLYLTLNDQWLIMPEFGFGGITYSSNSMTVSIDSDNCTEKVIKNELGAMIAHELNHTSRMIDRPIKNWDDVTLLEDITSEGIALVFQEKLYPNSSLYINKDVLDNFKEWETKAKVLYNKQRSQYDRNKWFFGDSNTPRWIGYTLGYKLVNDFFVKNEMILQKLTSLDQNILA